MNEQAGSCGDVVKDAPTLYVSFGGVLNIGHGLVDVHGEVTLDSGRMLFKYAPYLIDVLEPWPNIQLVLTTYWLRKLGPEKIIGLLPTELIRRVVGTTKDTPPRLGELRDGSARACIPIRHARKHGMSRWLALDDECWGIPVGFEHHFLRTEPTPRLVLRKRASSFVDGSRIPARIAIEGRATYQFRH